MASGGDLAEETYLKKIEGSWIGEGQLTNGEGEETEIREEWTGAFQDDGSFAMKGQRQFGEESQEFRWVFVLNASTELYECEYWHTGMEEEIRLEVQMREDSVKLRTPFGDQGGELVIENSIEGGKIKGLISLKDSSGRENLGGEVLHSRRE